MSGARAARPTTGAFVANSRRALADRSLQDALSRMRTGFQSKRAAAAAALPEFDALRDAACEIKDHVLAHLDHYLERYEAKVIEAGGEVHWARDAAEARDIVLRLCRSVDARVATKSKTMIAEEIDLNAFLERQGMTVVETDLGEYIVQLAGERPSHIIVPAIHKTKDQVSDLFLAHHAKYGKTKRLTAPPAMVAEARAVLRQRYFDADVGITGANFLIAETGSVVLVTNEGNADLTITLPRMHIVIASLEKLVPTFENAATLLRVLARSATGQEMSAYTTLITGPRRAGAADGPEQFHVVLLDNGRSRLLGTPVQDILRCIRCGACLNHCPVYSAIGGHAYGAVYAGPVGAVLTPALVGLDQAIDLPNASSFCGRCESVCPMRIPLPRMMRHWRRKQFEARLTPPRQRAGLALWAALATRPRLYHVLTRLAIRAAAALGGRKGRFRRVPLAAGWTDGRDLPAPEGATFQALWAARARGKGGR